MPNVTLWGGVQVNPEGVEAETDRLTVPVSPFRAVTVIVEVAAEPARIWLELTALAEIVKSTTWNRMLEVVWVSEPLVPVMVTV